MDSRHYTSGLQPSFYTDLLLKYVDFFHSDGEASTQEGGHGDDKEVSYAGYLQV